MKKILSLILVSTIATVIYAQKIEISEAELQIKFDSIVAEGDLLYRYERAAWVSTDLIMNERELRKDFAGFFVYEDKREIKALIQGRKAQNCISEYVFESDFNTPKLEKHETREFTAREKHLMEIKSKILEQISDRKYEVTIPNDYSPNFILLPNGDKFRLYIIMGTTQRDVVPFGNDYVFFTDEKGNIESWQKFHSRIIPGYTKMNGEKVISFIHSHLRTTPFITSTDICTFRLYAPLYDIKEFSVYSPAIGKYMKYDLKENKITTK